MSSLSLTQNAEEMPIPSTAATITIKIPVTTLVTTKISPTTAISPPMVAVEDSLLFSVNLCNIVLGYVVKVAVQVDALHVTDFSRTSGY